MVFHATGHEKQVKSTLLCLKQWKLGQKSGEKFLSDKLLGVFMGVSYIITPLIEFYREVPFKLFGG